MDAWELVWIISLIAAIGGFAYISFKVIIKGIAEVRGLLEATKEL